VTNSFIDDLRDIPGLNDLNSTGPVRAKKPAKDKPTFPCESCNGSGKYRGVRVHMQEDKCFACKGKGFYYTSYADRMASRQKSAARKQSKLAAAQNEFNKLHPELIQKARALLLPWNQFATGLIEQYDAKGDLSEKQVAALQNQIDKAEARNTERAAALAAEQKKRTENPVDTSALRELFNGAKERGLKKPGLWFGDLKISEAPSHGRNAGSLYVKQAGEYVGKIDGSTFHPAWGVKQAPILEALLEIAKSPAEALRVKGKETGRCCCCGRELTDPESVAAGIGPICASTWGL